MMIVSGILGFFTAMIVIIALMSFRHIRDEPEHDVNDMLVVKNDEFHISPSSFIVELPDIAPSLVVKATQPCFHITANGQRVYEPFYITLVDTHDMNSLVEKLCDNVRRFNFTIRLFDKTGYEFRTWTVNDAWVKDVFMTTLDYNETKQCRVSLTVQCDGLITAAS